MVLSNSGKLWRDIFIAVVTFGLGFCAVAALVHAGLGDSLHLYASGRSEKLRLLDDWNGKAYSASFGSSHMHNGFDPRVFDAALKGTPAATHSVNLAIEGGSQTEQRAMALEFTRLLQPPPNSAALACVVILELGAGANFTNDHLVHPRAINIYDWPTTRFAARLTSPEMSAAQRLGRQAYAMAAMGLHDINLGMLSNRIFGAPFDQQVWVQETKEDRRGIDVLEPNPTATAEVTRMFAAATKPMRVKEGLIMPGNRDLADDIRAASRVKNLQLAYVVMPKVNDLQEMLRYPEAVETAHGDVPVINVAQPDRYPQLYHPNLWHDGFHLNQEGAALATRLIAEDLTRWYATHGAPGACGM